MRIIRVLWLSRYKVVSVITRGVFTRDNPPFLSFAQSKRVSDVTRRASEGDQTSWKHAGFATNVEVFPRRCCDYCAGVSTQEIMETPACHDLANIHVRVLLSFQQPTFHKFTKQQLFSAAWSAFRLKHIAIYFVSSESMKCRLLKLLLDHLITTTTTTTTTPTTTTNHNNNKNSNSNDNILAWSLGGREGGRLAETLLAALRGEGYLR